MASKCRENLKEEKKECYYDVSMDTDPAKSGKTPKKTWVFKTDKNGHVVLGSDHLVSGDSFYVVNGQPVFPLGTITLQETKHPEGWEACRAEAYARNM